MRNIWYSVHMTREEFIFRAKNKHPEGRYDYSKLEDTFNTREKTQTFICSVHGDFEQKPSSHLGGYGCYKCGLDTLRATFSSGKNTFIEKAREAHGDVYDYSRVEYVNNKTPVEIICTEHGSFMQSPGNHISSHRPQGCPVCARRRQTGRPPIPKEDVVKRLIGVHGDRYDYSTLNYRTWSDRVTIICPNHGEFEQYLSNHLRGSGCPGCGRENRVDFRTLTTVEFIRRAESVHTREKYDYSKVEYKSARTPVTITCPAHGEFSQVAYEHLRGARCPRCSLTVSSQHNRVMEWLDELGVEYTFNNRKIIPPRELDIYIPEHNLAIEVNGEYWHRADEKGKYYHYEKFRACEDAGVRLMQFWAMTDVERKPNVVKSMIENALGRTERRVYARKTEVRELTVDEYRTFMDNNHLEGYRRSKIKLGLLYGGEIVAAIGFSTKRGHWEIDRFASALNTSVVGGFSRLMKHRPDGELLTYSYNHYSQGSLYRDYGFSLLRENKHTLYYWHEDELKNRNHFMRYKSAEKLGIPDSDTRTEAELALELGATQVFGSGTRTWVLHCPVIYLP